MMHGVSLGANPLPRFLLITMGLGSLGSGTACSRSIELFPEVFFEDPSVGVDASPPLEILPGMSWGDYAATLDVPPCPEGHDLVVDSLGAELDGGEDITDASQAGPTLSFVEAIWIASNRGGQNNIYFSPTVFPANNPGRIRLERPDGPVWFPITNQASMCIDGRKRGVIIEWPDDEKGFHPEAIWGLYDSLQVGITLWNIQYEQSVLGSQVAGCRIGTDGFAVPPTGYGRLWQIVIGEQSRVGPGNVFAGRVAIRTAGSGPMRVTGNSFGWDPITSNRFRLDVGIDGIVGNPVQVDGNVFATEVAGIQSSPWDTMEFDIHHNYFGVDPSGATLGMEGSGVELNGSTSRFGPGNIVRGAEKGVVVGAVVHITRNSISGNAVGILNTGSSPVPPPVITAVSSTKVSGTCEVDGLVQIFSDPGDQGEDFLGEVDCIAGVEWDWTGPIEKGKNITATLTVEAAGTSEFSMPLPIP